MLIAQAPSKPLKPQKPLQKGSPFKSRPLAKLGNPVLLQLASRRIAEWNQQLKQLKAVQTAIVLSHCRKAAITEFGKTHGFQSIRDYESFKNQVPLRNYKDFEPYLNRMRQGQSDILWPGVIPFYGQSSGSSGTQSQNKFLPLSYDQIRWQKKAGFDLLARYLHLTQDRSFLGGFQLGLFPPSILKRESPGIYQGSNPGIMMRFLPPLVKWISLPKNPIRDIPQYDRKLAAIAKHYFHYDVRSLGGTTCWFGVIFDYLIQIAKENGSSATHIKDIWPNLRVLFGGGVSAEPYKKLLVDRIGHNHFVLMDNYNATEGGIFAVSDSLVEPGLLCIPDRGVFFEFVPIAEHGKPNPTRVPLWEVEPNVDYSVVVTTASGLFGYYLGDFVRFLSIFPHRLEFRGRASGMLSLTQELTTASEIEQAVSYANEACQVITVDYSVSGEVGVDQSGKSRYLFFMEFERPPAQPHHYLALIDQELCRQNRVYREHRAENVALLPPELIILEPHTVPAFMEAIGQAHFQNKFPRIVDPIKLEQLKRFCAQQTNLSIKS